MKAKIQIKDVFKITGRGVVMACEILEGTISNGDKIIVGDNEYTIKGVEGFCSIPPTTNVGLIIKSEMDIDELKTELLKYKETEAAIK